MEGICGTGAPDLCAPCNCFLNFVKDDASQVDCFLQQQFLQLPDAKHILVAGTGIAMPHKTPSRCRGGEMQNPG